MNVSVIDVCVCVCVMTMQVDANRDVEWVHVLGPASTVASDDTRHRGEVEQVRAVG